MLMYGISLLSMLTYGISLLSMLTYGIPTTLGRFERAEIPYVIMESEEIPYLRMAVRNYIRQHEQQQVMSYEIS
jgi:hypothetical protein